MNLRGSSSVSAATVFPRASLHTLHPNPLIILLTNPNDSVQHIFPTRTLLGIQVLQKVQTLQSYLIVKRFFITHKSTPYEGSEADQSYLY